jgi:hypothetical protein
VPNGSSRFGGTTSLEDRLGLEDGHDAGVIAVLTEHTAAQPWWLGYLETGPTDVVFKRAHEVDPSVKDATPPGHTAY